jgi:hypothetical protein
MPDQNVQNTQDESIEESLRKIITHFTGKIFTSMPGKIEKIYDLNNQRLADVKPTIMDTRIIDGDKVSIEYPSFPMVPLFILAGGGFYSSLPIAEGDPCVLHTIQHNNDLYLKSDGKTVIDSNHLRRHDPNDSFAVAGHFLPYINIPGISSTDMVMGKVDDSCKIVITAENEVKIKADRINAGSMDATKALALAEKVNSNFDSFKTNFDLHTHVCVSPGVPCAPPAVGMTSPEDTDSEKVFTDG